MNEAAILAARRSLQEISKDEIADALERIIAGPEKKVSRGGWWGGGVWRGVAEVGGCGRWAAGAAAWAMGSAEIPLGYARRRRGAPVG